MDRSAALSAIAHAAFAIYRQLPAEDRARVAEQYRVRQRESAQSRDNVRQRPK